MEKQLRKEAADRIMLPLDFSTYNEAAEPIEKLGGQLGLFKVGFELISSGAAHRVASRAFQQNAGVFWDGKFKDIPNTVERACRILMQDAAISMLNVHADGGSKMMKAARKGIDEGYERRWRDASTSVPPRPKLLAVTILTSLGYDDLVEISMFTEVERGNGGHDEQIRQRVVSLAKLAQDSGADGVVASPKEIEAIRTCCGPGFLIVTPGVRPDWASKDDQSRVMTPFEAISLGADYLVIGRPITQPPAEIGDSASAVTLIADEIAQALAARAPIATT
ncbi:MAG: orotidine-5'-phosphate decarboxylase [Candidatus Berkelbacteria bacterium]|nr:MAG: orotidine-5'-phosphate decarboxylase [Candidatus Berkelbacteria bacterium]QQG51783.1 MAG: orotidine-5'-phosphate decarboxylase [Candidatus Berkelbacteria bacterium]